MVQMKLTSYQLRAAGLSVSDYKDALDKLGGVRAVNKRGGATLRELLDGGLPAHKLLYLASMFIARGEHSKALIGWANDCAAHVAPIADEDRHHFDAGSADPYAAFYLASLARRVTTCGRLAARGEQPARPGEAEWQVERLLLRLAAPDLMDWPVDDEPLENQDDRLVPTEGGHDYYLDVPDEIVEAALKHVGVLPMGEEAQLGKPATVERVEVTEDGPVYHLSAPNETDEGAEGLAPSDPLVIKGSAYRAMVMAADASVRRQTDEMGIGLKVPVIPTDWSIVTVQDIMDNLAMGRTANEALGKLIMGEEERAMGLEFLSTPQVTATGTDPRMDQVYEAVWLETQDEVERLNKPTLWQRIKRWWHG